MEWKRYHLHSSKLACIIQMLILQSAGQFKRPYRHRHKVSRVDFLGCVFAVKKEGPNYLQTWCVDRHPKKVFFVLISTPCSVELWPKRGVLVRLTRQRLTGLLTGPNAEVWTRFGPVTQTGCQSFVWLTGPKRGQSSAFWPQFDTPECACKDKNTFFGM
ncbi:hypothetical protein Hanom_Chr16g01510951 [Helianthus anomalus]